MTKYRQFLHILSFADVTFSENCCHAFENLILLRLLEVYRTQSPSWLTKISVHPNIHVSVSRTMAVWIRGYLGKRIFCLPKWQRARTKVGSDVDA